MALSPRSACLVVAATLLAGGVVRAQDVDDADRRGFSWSVGVGATTAGISCAPHCSAPRQSGPAISGWAGGHVSPQLALGIAGTSYQSSSSSTAGNKWTLSWILLTSVWYPNADEDFFIKAGIGLAAVKAEVTFPTVGLLGLSTTDFGAQFGIGRDFRITDRLALSLFADYLVTPRSQAVIDGVNGGARASADLIQVGISLGRP